jgi:hypothetical protein
MSRSVSVLVLTVLMSVFIFGSAMIFELSVQYCIVHVAGERLNAFFSGSAMSIIV